MNADVSVDFRHWRSWINSFRATCGTRTATTATLNGIHRRSFAAALLSGARPGTRMVPYDGFGHIAAPHGPNEERHGSELSMILNAIQAGEGPPVVLLHGLFGAARNFGAVQRALAPRYRVIALDMRNHGDSPHEPDMRYATLAADVRQTLLALGVGQAAMIGHSMGGKAAMAMALQWPDLVGRLLVSDIAPVIYQHGNTALTAAIRAIPLTPGLTRREADIVLAEAVADPTLRPFLLQNLRFGAEPVWRIGLDEIAAAITDLEGWADLPGRYAGPTLFVTGAASNYVLPEHRPVIRAWFPAARFVAVKHAGHWVHADNPAGFLAVVEAFLHDWR